MKYKMLKTIADVALVVALAAGVGVIVFQASGCHKFVGEEYRP